MSSEFVALGAIIPDGSTRLGRMLSAGHLQATMTSKRTGEHISLRLDACLKNDGFPKWKHVPFAEATHIFINVVSGDRVATYYPKTGKFYPAKGADPARIWAAEKTLIAAALRAGVEVREEGEGTMGYVETLETTHYTLVSSNNCGHCHADLTDPVSIARGFGPTCFGNLTGSKHQTKAQRKLPVNTQQPATVSRDLQPVGEIIAAVTDGKGRSIPKTFEELAGQLGRA